MARSYDWLPLPPTAAHDKAKASTSSLLPRSTTQHQTLSRSIDVDTAASMPHWPWLPNAVTRPAQAPLPPPPPLAVEDLTLQNAERVAAVSEAMPAVQELTLASFEDVLRLIQNGSIVEAMGQFKSKRYRARRRSLLKSATPKQFEQVIIYLARAVRQPRPLPRHTHAKPGFHWRPAMMPEHMSPFKLSPAQQALFAMSYVHDEGVRLGYAPTSRSVRAMLSSFTHAMPRESQLPFINTLFRNFTCPLDTEPGAPVRLTDINASDIDIHLLRAFIIAYGHAGQAQRGEELLAWYAKSHLANGEEAHFVDQHPVPTLRLPASLHRPTLAPPACLPLNAWSHSVDIWTALVRGRARAGDIRGALTWLERYRHQLAENEADSGLKPAATSAPYHALAIACTGEAWPQSAEASARPLQQGASDAESDAAAQRLPERTSAVRAILLAAARDGAKLSLDMLSFIMSFEAGCGRFEKATRVFLRAVETGIVRGPPQSAHGINEPLFVTLCKLHLRYAPTVQDYSSPFDRLAGELHSRSELLESIQSPRALLRMLLASHHAYARYTDYHRSPLMNAQCLHAVMEAALLAKDYPAALAAFRSYGVYRLHFDSSFAPAIERAWMRDKEHGMITLSERMAASSAGSSLTLQHCVTSSRVGDTITAHASPAEPSHRHLTSLLSDLIVQETLRAVDRQGARQQHDNAAPSPPWAMRAAECILEDHQGSLPSHTNEQLREDALRVAMRDANNDILPHRTSQQLTSS